jgi:Cation/multidrug efflux pump
MCLFSSIYGVWLRSMENNIFTQIGFVVLVGLACKNAILIVEFANKFKTAIKKIASPPRSKRVVFDCVRS